MNTIYAGPSRCIDAGEVAEFPVDQALDLVAGGYAEALEPFPAESAPVNPSSDLAPDSEEAPAADPVADRPADEPAADRLADEPAEVPADAAPSPSPRSRRRGA